MPKRCAAYNCRGNYIGEPYTPVVSFPTDDDERKRWIEAMPNDPGSLTDRKEIFVCASHFECKWVTVRGGKRPIGPPTYFKGVAKSCLKQTLTYPRPTKKASSEVREKLQEEYLDKLDRIDNFLSFTNEAAARYTSFSVRSKCRELTMFMLDELGRKVVQFIYFKEIESLFGFLHLVEAEKDGFAIPKRYFSLQKNNLLHRWSQVDEILSTVENYQVSNSDHLAKVMYELKQMTSEVQARMSTISVSRGATRKPRHPTIKSATQSICLFSRENFYVSLQQHTGC